MAEKKKARKKSAKKSGKKPGRAAEGPIKKTMGIREIVEKYPESIGVLASHGFHCLGCIAAQFETLEQGAQAHGIDPDKLVEEMNKAVKEKKE
jgi:hybrid cluster-associated redox disulfide protein